MTTPTGRATAVAERIAGRAADHDATAAFPSADVEDLRRARLLGLMVGADLGGLGATFRDYVDVARTLAHGSAPTALLFNMHASVTGALAGISPDMAAALGAGDDFVDQRAEILRRAAEGAMYGVAISEAGTGSRLSQVTTTYHGQGGGYRIVGDKVACSGAGHLDGYLVAARSGDSTDVPVISYFLVPGDGIQPVGDWNPLGMRATASRGARIDTVVPAGALLGGVEGLAVLLAYDRPEWLVGSYAAVYVGLAEAVLDQVTVALADRAASRHGAVDRLGRADAAVAAARLAVEHAARCVDDHAGEYETSRALYRAKLLAGDTAMEVAASLTEASGLSSLVRGAPLERAFRDARFGALMPPRSDVCAEYLGTARLGMDPAIAMEEPPW
jgi:alkylation response protein AidB-like acyl-CoA dehydrogenase